MNSQVRKRAALTPFTKCNGPQPLGNRLRAYATMAGAGIAACASPAEAEIVYTPAHANIHFNYPLDLNHDGIPDFSIFSSSLSGFSYLGVVPSVTGNKIAVAASHKSCLKLDTVSAAALAARAEIGPVVSFEKHATCMAAGYNGLNNGPWVEAKNRYLGLAFLIEGKIHYGWAGLTVNEFYCVGCMARIEGYAYETIPGRAIRAGDEGKAEETSGEPGSLGKLALGARARSSWRKVPGEE